MRTGKPRETTSRETGRGRRGRAPLLFALLTALLLAMSLGLMACGSSDDDDDIDADRTPAGDVIETDPYYNMSDAELEALKEKAQVMNKEEDNFYGTWKANGDEAYNLYGSLTVHINKDGSFVADISDETFQGSWKKIDGGISFNAEDIITGTMFFGEYCEMTIDNAEWDYDDEEEGMAVTLEKVK